MSKPFSKFWGNLRKEKWLMLFCFVLAFFAWQGIRRNLGFEVSVSDILVDVDVPEGVAVWEKSTHRVNILFRGSREDIRYLNNEQLRVVIPLPNPAYGEDINVKLSEKFLRNPTGAKVVRFSPSDVTVKLDHEGERLLPVKATINGTLPEGLEVDRIVCTPASVRVFGAQQVLDGMESIHTETIELKDRQATFKESIPVALPQAGRMQVDPDWVSVEFILEERSSVQSFENVEVKIMCASGEQRHFNIHPQTISVTVKGQQQRIEQMRSSDVFAFVSCSDLAENTGYDLPVVLDLPQDVQLVKTVPTVVHVDVEN
ncbi:CdaR family protein [Pontiella sulfatireligans]|uniref:CdaA regulatory protein CdaR n=1 Tax=Pontiella sulfatireligans TaxID=2750658 RepID=A0A6C2USF7_9BACT|nr:CdaR family protein [Pontiella sulfatireligans]VGO22157.1 CdaA regulatory protein CdaR [Pontiella sulfatireligans]